MNLLIYDKPIKNLRFFRDEEDGDEWWFSETPIGTYCIQRMDDSELFEAVAPDFDGLGGAAKVCEGSKTLEHAKRCCQQHFQTIVMQCFQS